MANPPTLTPEQRQLALEKAAVARRQRAEVFGPRALEQDGDAMSSCLLSRELDATIEILGYRD